MNKNMLGNCKEGVTVITVCFNALEDLKSTARSVKGQTAHNISHIIIDGGSSDGTPEWLLENKKDFFIAISEPDNGIYDAMNKALDLCPNNMWVIFLNAGDTFSSEESACLLLNTLERDDVDIIFGGVKIQEFLGSNRTKTYLPRNYSKSEMPGCHQSCFVRTKILRKLKFDLNYQVAADFEFWMRATHLFGCKTGLTNYIVSIVAPEGYSAKNEPLLQQEYYRVIMIYFGWWRAQIWLFNRKLKKIANQFIFL